MRLETGRKVSDCLKIRSKEGLLSIAFSRQDDLIFSEYSPRVSTYFDSELLGSLSIFNSFSFYPPLRCSSEILIFGTGQTVLPPPAKVKNYLNSLGIQVDVQDSVSRSFRNII